MKQHMGGKGGAHHPIEPTKPHPGYASRIPLLTLLDAYFPNHPAASSLWDISSQPLHWLADLLSLVHFFQVLTSCLVPKLPASIPV